MKLNEIMVIKKDGTGNRLKLFQVDDDTLARLTKIRGNLYRDDSRLWTMADIPTMQQPQTPEPVISPEMARREAAAYLEYIAGQAATATPAAIQPQPMSFEEKLQYDWKHSPSLRNEFVSFGSYQAYMRAAESGRAKVYGCKS